MNSKLIKLAAAGALSCCIATSAFAGSVTQPGETVGLASGAPLPEGLYSSIPGTGAIEVGSTHLSESISRSWLGRLHGRSSAAGYSS